MSHTVQGAISILEAHPEQLRYYRPIELLETAMDHLEDGDAELAISGLARIVTVWMEHEATAGEPSYCPTETIHYIIDVIHEMRL